MSHVPHELAEEFPNDTETLHTLKTTNAHFAKLADEYHTINREIHRIEAGIEAVADEHAEDLKKMRLKLMDEISAIISSA